MVGSIFKLGLNLQVINFFNLSIGSIIFSGVKPIQHTLGHMIYSMLGLSSLILRKRAAVARICFLRWIACSGLVVLLSSGTNNQWSTLWRSIWQLYTGKQWQQPMPVQTQNRMRTKLCLLSRRRCGWQVKASGILNSEYVICTLPLFLYILCSTEGWRSISQSSETVNSFIL